MTCNDATDASCRRDDVGGYTDSEYVIFLLARRPSLHYLREDGKKVGAESARRGGGGGHVTSCDVNAQTWPFARELLAWAGVPGVGLRREGSPKALFWGLQTYPNPSGFGGSGFGEEPY